MCIFSGPVEIVAGTAIVAGLSLDKKMRFMYSNRVACKNGNIMVLPVDSDKVDLIELPGKYKKIGQQIADNYDTYYEPKLMMQSYSNSMPATNSAARSFAEIINYGPYIVSMTPNLDLVDWDNFGGLENRDEFFDFMYETYPKYMFIIAKINKNKADHKSENKLPIFCEYIPRDIANIKLPTLHIHNGKVEDVADWDHYIFILNGMATDLKNKPMKILALKDPKVNIRLSANDLEEKFPLVNDLYNDYNFEDIKYATLTRIKRWSDVANIDIGCHFNNIVYTKPSKPIVLQKYDDLEKKMDEYVKRSMDDYMKHRDDKFNQFIWFLIIIFIICGMGYNFTRW